MISKKKRLAACKLYLILDTQVCNHGRLWEVVRKAISAGVDIVQLRDKIGSANETLKFARRIQFYLADRIPFIVNDRVDIALLSGASGVHVGQDDLSVAEARKILGPGKIVGTSCQTVTHLRRAFFDGADYVGFGSIFKTLTKPERSPMDQALLRKAALLSERMKVPLFAIGGITAGNLTQVVSCGVARVAVCRDILLARDFCFSVGKIRQRLTVTLK